MIEPVQESPAEAAYNKALALRESHMRVERALRAAQSLFKVTAFFTGILACSLTLQAVVMIGNPTLFSNRLPLISEALQEYVPVTSLTIGALAGLLFLVYWLHGVATEELVPGKGKPRTKFLSLGLLLFISVFFIFPLGLLFSICPAWHLLGSRSDTVLSVEYGKSVNLTPDITAREANRSAISRQTGVILLALLGLVLIASVFALV